MSEREQDGGYDVHAVEAKWQPVWEKLDPFRADDTSPREKFYALTMFPYPSGDLHMGHAEVTALHDVIARYKWMRGYEVLNPIGWDSFGLPAENAAIRNDEHPAAFTYDNIETQAESFKKYAVSFDWSRRLHTSDPEYYRWTQWLFGKFYQRGLAYRKASPVNWCPNYQTVLANEQVVDGMCERCGAIVTKRELTQWFFKVTDYAQRLLDDMEGLQDTWPDRVLTMQRNWIGRSEGAHVDFAIEGREQPVTVFTTRPDTLFGATFFVVAADAALAAEPVTDDRRPAFEAYLERVRRASDIDRLASDRPKTGVFLGRYAINPVNGEKLPVWAADYVLAEAGTGAIMAVPGGEERDFAFAQVHDLPVIHTVRRRRVSTAVPTSVTASPSTRRTRRSTSTAWAWTRPSVRSPRTWSSAASGSVRSTSGCATGCCRGSSSGVHRSRSSTARTAVRCRFRRTSCRWCCRTCRVSSSSSTAASRRWRTRPTG